MHRFIMSVLLLTLAPSVFVMGMDRLLGLLERRKLGAKPQSSKNGPDANVDVTGAP